MATPAEMGLDSAELRKRVERFQAVRDGILAQVRQVIVGQDEVLDQILTALFVGGHCLITGMPGTPKTQAALLEAMQEHSCTVRGHIYRLPAPFFVLATQNPIELEGTYPLPEAQLDRFLFNSTLDYLSAEEELKVVDLTTTTRVARIEAVTSAEELLDFQQLVRMVPIADSIARYVVNLVRATRHRNDVAPDFVKKYVNYGGSIRAAQFIVLAAKARALSRKRYHVTYDDVTSVTLPVLRHRILLNFHAESDSIDSDEILNRLVAHVARPKET